MRERLAAGHVPAATASGAPTTLPRSSRAGSVATGLPRRLDLVRLLHLRVDKQRGRELLAPEEEPDLPPQLRLVLSDLHQTAGELDVPLCPKLRHELGRQQL